MRIFLICFTVLLFSFELCLAQESTLSPSKKEEPKTGELNVMVVPFDPILYSSDIDREIGRREGFAFEEIREKFRYSLDFTIGSYLKTNYFVIAPLRERDEVVKTDLAYLFSSVNYNYQAIPSGSVEGKTEGVETHKRSSSSKQDKSTILKNGQITTTTNPGEKFMCTVIKDKEALTYLNKKYKTDYYLFINQFEIKTDLANIQLNKQLLKVHYSVFDNKGKLINGGIAVHEFIPAAFEVKEVVKGNFDEIAKILLEKIPVKHPSASEFDGK